MTSVGNNAPWVSRTRGAVFMGGGDKNGGFVLSFCCSGGALSTPAIPSQCHSNRAALFDGHPLPHSVSILSPFPPLW